jgi:MFS family permease
MNIAGSSSPIKRTFAALNYPNFRFWFYGQIVSLFGTWMQNTAQGFLIYELTHSPAYLGYVGFASGAPSWIFMLIGGVITDRLPRRTLLIITQASMMILAFILATFTFLGIVQPWHIIALSFLLGIANAFDAPARMALAPELVERDDITNAIALNAIMFNLAAIVGPAAAGIVYALVGPGWCFTLNGLTYLAVIAALILMRLPKPLPRFRPTSAFSELGYGIRYVINDRLVRGLIGLVGFTAFFGFSFVILLPAWAVDVLGGDVITNGWLNSARGAGALFGAIVIAYLGQSKNRGRLLTVGMFLFPVFMIIFSFARWLPMSLLFLCGAGAALVFILNLANAIIQTRVSDDLRGRVMSIYSLTFFGLIPIGSLLIGQFANVLGEPIVLLMGSLILFIFAFVVWLLAPSIRLYE